MNLWSCVAIGLSAALLTGCSSDEPPSPSGQPRTVTTSPSSSPDGSSIVGTWLRTTTCQERVDAFTDAGMAAFAAESVVGQGFIPGSSDVSQLSDPQHPCVGAVPQEHSHVFTEDGAFASLDQAGQPADDGTYELPSPGVVEISNADIGTITFDYTIEEGALELKPRLPGCASKGCFEAQWATSVSYLGLPWAKA